MPSGGNDFIIRLITKFESQGLGEVAAAVRRELSDLAKTNPGGFSTQAPDVLRAGEIATTRLSETSALPLNSQRSAAGLDVSRVGARAEELGRQYEAGTIKQKEYNDAMSRLVVQATARERSLLTGLNKEFGIGLDPSQRDTLRQGGLFVPGQGPGGFVQGAAGGGNIAAEEIAQTRIDAAKLGNAVREILLVSSEYTPLLAAEAKLRAELKGSLDEQLAVDKNYVAATVLATNARKDKTAAETRGLIGDPDAAAKRAEEQQVKAQYDLLTKAHRLGVDPASGDLAAEVAQSERTAANLRAAAAAKGAGEEDIKAAVQRRASESALNRAILQREKAYIKDAIRTGEIPAGTRFQNLKANLSPTAQVPQDFQTLGQFVGSKVLNTVGYGIGGAALFGAVSGTKQLLDDAEKLEKALNRVKAQFETLGQAGDFSRARQSILGIAKDTGVAAADVADTFFQFKGAFGNTDVALENTASAMKLVQVTGISLAESIDSLTAIAKTFGTSITDVGDLAIGLEERFGVLAKETIAYLGDTAAVAKEAGLSLADTAAIGAAAQQASGRAGSANAEALNRILPSLQASKEAILEAYRASPELAGKFGAILDAFSQSKSGDVLKQIILDFDKLDSSQQANLIKAIGGRREAQALIPILQQHVKLAKEFGDNVSNPNRDSGKLASRFEDLQTTVANTSARLSQVFKGLGQALFNLGLADVIVKFTTAVSFAVTVVTKLISLFSDLNNATKLPFLDQGLLAVFVQLAAVAFIAAKAIDFLTSAKVKSFFGSKALTEAEAETVVAKTAVAEASAREATTESGLIIVKGRSAAASEAEAIAEGTSGAAKTGRIASFFGSGGLGNRALTQNSIFKGGGANVSGAVGGSTLAAGVAFAGAAVVADKYQETRSGIERSVADFREKLKKATEKDLQAIADSRSSAMDKIAIGFFGQDLPEVIAAKQINTNASAAGVKNLSALNDTNPSGVKTLVDNLNEANTKTLLDFINRNQDNRNKALDDLGGKEGNHNSLLGDALTGGNTNITSIDKDKLAKKLPDYIKQAAAGDAFAAEIVDFINQTLSAQGNNQVLLKQVQDAVAAGDEADAIKLAGGVANLASLKIGTAKAQRDSGAISTSQYLETIRANIDVLEQERAKGGEAFTDQNAADLAAAQQALQDEILKRAKSISDSAAAIAQLTGSATPKAVELQNLLNTVNSTGLDTNGQLAQVPALLQAVQAAFQEELNGIKDPVARAAAARKGFKIPPELQTLLARQQLTGNETFETGVKDVANFLGTSYDKLFTQIVAAVKDGDKTAADASDRVFQAQIDGLQQLLDTIPASSRARSRIAIKIQRLRKAMAEADAAFGGVAVTPAGENALPTPDEQNALDDGATNALNQKAQSALAIAAALNSGNPVAAAQINLQKANADLAAALALKDNNNFARDIAVANARASVASANQGIQQALDGIAKANIGWLTVFANGDPVKLGQAQRAAAELDLAIARRNGDKAGIIAAQQAIATSDQTINDALEQTRQAVYGLAASREKDPYKAALIKLQAANDALAAAKGTAAQASAQQAVEQIQRDIAQVIDDGIKAQSDLAISIANAAGDTVKAAGLALAEAKRELDKAKADGAGVQQIAQLQANVVSAAASQRDAEFNTQQKHIDFLLQIGDITTGQAISMLEALRQIPDLTQDELDQITLKIKGLQDSLSGDFKFNLPTNLALGTSYEARRTVQSGGAGAYNDNRVITTQIIVPDGTSLTDLQTIVDNAINPGTNAPTSTKRYP